MANFLNDLNRYHQIADEVRRARKRLALSPEAHAQKVGVSLARMLRFDVGDTSLTVEEIHRILHAVELVPATTRDGSLDGTIAEALRRWRRHTAKLSPGTSARFPNGHYCIGYALKGKFVPRTTRSQLKILNFASPPSKPTRVFRIVTHGEFNPREVDGALEAWHGTRELEKPVDSPENNAFWLVTESAASVNINGYREDSGVPPGTTFDPVEAAVLLAQAMYHADEVCRRVKADSPAVLLHASFHGLRGRVLRTLNGQPQVDFSPSHAAAVDTVHVQRVLNVSRYGYPPLSSHIWQDLEGIVSELLKPFGHPGVVSSQLLRDRYRSELSAVKTWLRHP